jgi:anti-anti-sigma factor
MSNPSSAAAKRVQCTVDEQWQDTTVILSCTGVIDMLTAPDLERHLAAALEGNPTSMIVDLTNVDFLASQGMSVFIATRELCADTTQFVVVADGPATSRPMQLVGLTDIITVHATLEKALEAQAAAPLV